MLRCAVCGRVAGILIGLLAFAGCSRHSVDVARVIREATREDLVRFGSDAEFREYADRLAQAQRQQYAHEAEEADDEGGGATGGAAAVQAEAGGEAPSGPGGGESITNIQEAGVDEGGIVKAHGDYLIVLRRGRLFSIRVADGELHPVSAVSAYPPGETGEAWYDEMLVHDDTIVVVGYSYPAQATEIGLFDFGSNGVISHRASYHLKSNDYYSSRNYASRLIGDTLVFYMPHSLMSQEWQGGAPNVTSTLPTLRRWAGRQNAGHWDRIVDTTEIYRPIQPVSTPVLHTVVTCDLSSHDLHCRARGILGPYSRTFYVSASAVYVWVASDDIEPGVRQQQEPGLPRSVVYRLPLRAGEPGALRTWGVPTDQFSFKEDDGGYLNVLVRAEGSGDAMWAPEVRAGAVALMRVPLEGITTRVGAVRPAAYTSLPSPERGYDFHDRFVGDHVLYGTGSGWGGTGESDRHAYVYRYRRGQGRATSLALPSGVDRIEAMGGSAVVVGSDGTSVHFSAIDLDGEPSIAGQFEQTNAAQGETRSHGFFYRSDGEDQGVLGLPLTMAGTPGFAQLTEGSAEVLFLGVHAGRFERLGSLVAHPSEAVDDHCVASCVDWYGNARPIFYRGRVLALLGYELVEGRIGDQSMTELARATLSSVIPR